jgi:hypothetical protein
MVFEAARLAARMGCRSAAAAAAPPLPQLLYERETATETRCNRGLRGGAGCPGMNKAITQSWRGWLHTSHDALNGPDMQLQTALVGSYAHSQRISSRYGRCDGWDSLCRLRPLRFVRGLAAVSQCAPRQQVVVGSLG